MGKKIKTLDHVIPPDVFEKLLLESQQAATVVLMLDSPEDDVVIKAGIALYQFSEKCDENKLVLLDLNALDKLVRLLPNDERKIRRVASMSIGSLSQHPDVRKALRKREETIPLLIRLLLWEEDVVVQEYVTLCLSSLAVDYSCKNSLCTYGAMEPLIHCLSSSDADVQKNAIQAIALMLQDYPSRICLREANGFSSIFDLLKSEYPVIQYYALLSLQLAAEDEENCAILSEMKISRLLVDFLMKPEASEMHVFAIMALINCIQNDKNMQAFRDCGGLHRLLAFITDIQANSEEEKKSKKEKIGSKPATGKKSRLDDEDDRQRGRGDVESFVAVMPDIREQVVRAIALASRNSENRKLLHEHDTERKLISLLGGDKTTAGQTAATLALGTMAASPDIRDTIAKLDGLDALMKLGKTDNAELLEALSLAYANLTKDSPSICNELVKKGFVEQLMSMITKTREMTVVCATLALSNIAADESLRSEIIGRKVISALAELLNSKSSLIQAKTLMALASYLLDEEAQKQLIEANCIESLLRLFESGDKSVTENASWLIYVLTSNETAATEICNKGGLNIVRQVQCSSTRHNAISELALWKLFGHQLSAKYAFTGILDNDNIITDCFYDPGRLRETDQLKTIEEYGAEPINDKRPILLISPKPQALVIETPLSEIIMISERASKGTVNTGHPAKYGRRRSLKEKEDKQKEEGLLLLQQQQQQQVLLKTDDKVETAKVYVIPGDNQLLQYITEVQELISVLPDSKEQITALARFVSDKMGGALDDEKLMKCNWDLAQSHLKTELKSNVIPIGMIRTGVHFHRALLFKVLCDRIALPCSLVRGDYNRAWNIVMVSEEILLLDRLGNQLKPYIIDLIHQPGKFLKLGSCEALAYQTIVTPPVVEKPELH